MAEQEQALNEVAESPTVSGNDSVSLIDTMPDPDVVNADPEGANNTEGEAQQETDDPNPDETEVSVEGEDNKAVDDKTDIKTPDKNAIDDDRFDKHPRFIELNERTKAAEKALQTVLATVGKATDTTPKPNEEQLTYEDVSKLSDEEITEQFEDDPKGFLTNLARQIRSEVIGDIKAGEKANAEKNAAANTFNEFAEKNAGFNEMYQSGELTKFIETHPGHNAMSAYLSIVGAVNEDAQQKAINAAVAKAVKETETKIIKNLKAKGRASVLGSGPSGPSGTAHVEAPELKDPNKFGGTSAVLASRLAAMRRARTG